jgi:hypothetical protein
MNSRLILTFVPLAGLLITGCNKSEPAAAPPARTAEAAPAPPPGPPMETPVPVEPLGPTESEKKTMEQVRALELRQAELQQQVEEEKLARLEAEMAAEQALLDQERADWQQEQPAVFIPDTGTALASLPAVGGSADYSTAGNWDYQTFYDDLAPYGTWYDSPDYGYCWQPSVYLTDTSWRPYTRGCWNACNTGWTWCSDEPFGWACYHYGRWARCRHRGWVWIPGDQWAPAWVCWRKNDKYVGWCPLPPETVYQRDCTWGPTVDTDCGIHPSCYVFVPVKHFDKPVLGYCEAPSMCLTICRSTVNITNIVCRPGRVHCEGPQYDWITRCVRRDVPRYNLAWDNDRGAHSRPAHRIEKDRIHFFAPKVQTPWNAALRPRHRTERLENSEFVRADGGVPQKLATRFKTERTEREKALNSEKDKNVRRILERHQKLAEMEKSRETLAAEAQRQAETVKSKLADGPQRPEVAVDKAPRAGSRVPQQSGGDVFMPTVPDRRQPTAPDRNSGIVRQPRETSRAKEIPDHTADSAASNRAAAEQAAALESARRQADARAAVGDTKRKQAATREAENLRNSRAEQVEEQRRRMAPAEPDTTAQKRQEESITRAEAANRESDRQRSTRAAGIEEQRRQQQAEALARAEAQTAALVERQRQVEAHRAAIAEQQREAAQRTAVENHRQTESNKERSRQQEIAREQSRAAEIRAAAMEQQRAAENDARAAQAARQREELERQRAAMEQQRRQEDANRAAQEEAARREAMQRQQEAAEQQRRQQEENQRRAEENAARQRESMEQQRRQQEEQQQQQRAAEESRRQAEENSRREASERARQDNDHKRGR